MIVTAFIQLLSFVLWLPILAMRTIEWVLPDTIIDALNYMFSMIAYADGLFPLTKRPEMTGLIAAMGMADIMIAGYQYMFYYFFTKLFLRLLRPLKVNVLKEEHYETVTK